MLIIFIILHYSPSVNKKCVFKAIAHFKVFGAKEAQILVKKK